MMRLHEHLKILHQEVTVENKQYTDRLYTYKFVYRPEFCIKYYYEMETVLKPKLLQKLHMLPVLCEEMRSKHLLVDAEVC